MSDDNRSRKDDEVESFVRSLRPTRMRSIATLVAIAATSVGSITATVSHHLSRVNGGRPTGQQPPMPAQRMAPRDRSAITPQKTTADRRKVSTSAVARQAVAIRTGTHDEDGYYDVGSGFLIADGFLVSAAHIFTDIPGSENAPVHVLCDDVERNGTVTVIDPIRDVVAISAPECHAGTLTFHNAEITASEGLHVSGYDFSRIDGLTAWFRNDTSMIPGVRIDPSSDGVEGALQKQLIGMKREHVVPFVAIAGAFAQGNSGSAVYDDGDRVVGMLVVIDPRFNRSYIVTAGTIMDVLLKDKHLVH